MRKFAGLSAALAIAGWLAGVTVAVAQPVPLATHRAFYELVLDSNKPGVRVDSARGRIGYEMTGGPCIGWAITLRQVTEIDNGEGKRTVSDLRSVTWEDFTAKSYRFKTQNYVDDQLRDEADGTAERSATGGFAVRLSKPKREQLALKGPILLPTEHIGKLIEAAAKGVRTLEAKVYDGAPDGKKVYDTLSVIGSAVTGDRDLEDVARVADLASLKRYPVTISYFEPGIGERMPVYVLGFELYENGVSRALKLDYGTFALRGDLKKLEFLPTTPCKR
jgi:hypothetical protein